MTESRPHGWRRSARRLMASAVLAAGVLAGTTVSASAAVTATFSQGVLSVTGDAGYINGWGGDIVRINDRFFKGGNSFRGFEIAGLGPRDTSLGNLGSSLGGKAYAIGTVELSFPNFLPDQYGIKTALFTDFGTVGLVDDAVKRNADGTLNTAIKDNMALRASAGVSIFWRSPSTSLTNLNGPAPTRASVVQNGSSVIVARSAVPRTCSGMMLMNIKPGIMPESGCTSSICMV